MTTESTAVRIHLNPTGSFPFPEELLAAGCRATLATQEVREGEVSVTFLDDAAMTKLNREYFDREEPTDVIAFALHEGPDPILADVYVGYQQARRQSEEYGVSLEEELLRLTVHGTLHALGHDHPSGPERTESDMFRLQEELVARVMALGRGGSL